MFIYVHGKEKINPPKGTEYIYLAIDNWNDYSFVTAFNLFFYDGQETHHSIGQVKIGFIGQTNEKPTHLKLERKFQNLGSNFFSLGQGTDYYRKLAKLPHNQKLNILTALQDLVIDNSKLDAIKNEDVFKISLLRYSSLSMVRGQYTRVVNGQPELTDFYEQKKKLLILI